jgi:hypothetical protein
MSIDFNTKVGYLLLNDITGKSIELDYAAALERKAMFLLRFNETNKDIEELLLCK